MCRSERKILLLCYRLFLLNRIVGIIFFIKRLNISYFYVIIVIIKI